MVRTISDVRADRVKQRKRKRDFKTKFDILPSPNAPKKQIEISLEKAKALNSHTGIAASSVLTGSLAAPKHARSIYVGGLPEKGVDEKDLYNYFNDVINKVTSQELNAIVSVYVHKLKGYGFIEVNDYNLATAVIQKLNGLNFNGKTLHLKRPTNYDPKRAPPEGTQPTIDVTKIGMKPGKPSGHVDNVPEKIYIAGIPTTINDDQLQELLEAFGELEALCIVKDRGYAFCLYKDRSVTDAAIVGLNGIILGSQMLTVKKAELNLRPENAKLNLSDINIVSRMLPNTEGLNSIGFSGKGGSTALPEIGDISSRSMQP